MEITTLYVFTTSRFYWMEKQPFDSFLLLVHPSKLFVCQKREDFFTGELPFLSQPRSEWVMNGDELPDCERTVKKPGR